MRIKNKWLLITLILSPTLVYSLRITPCHANDLNQMTLAFYSGPASPTPLIDLVQLKTPVLAPYYSLNLALNQRIFYQPQIYGLEAESSVSVYSESISNTSFQGALLFRWMKTPWSKVFSNSFAMGMGLSYALTPPQVEVITIPKTSNLLAHLVFEFAFDWAENSPWSGFFRIHHRSGAFGLFDGVVGGSDFLCLGLRLGL